jgi:hypothetical protein
MPTRSEVIFFAIMVACVLVVPGSDIYTHIHAAWLYNEMYQSHELLPRDPYMMNGQQPLYVKPFGPIIAAFFWFAFQQSAVKFLEVALFLALALITMKTFKDRGMLYIWYVAIFVKVLQSDEYPFLLSVFLFYLGIYLIKKFKSVLGDISILFAGVNHPVIAATNLVTMFFRRKWLFIGSVIVLILQLVAIKLFFFIGIVKFDAKSLIDYVFRAIIILFPLYYQLLPKQVSRIYNMKAAFILLIFGTLLGYPMMNWITVASGTSESFKCYYTDPYKDLPYLNGNIRVVDDCRAWTYLLPVKGMVSSLSSEFNGQYYLYKWKEKEYLDYMKESNTTYVVICTSCKIQTRSLEDTGELSILKNHFPLYMDLPRYEVYNISG